MIRSAATINDAVSTVPLEFVDQERGAFRSSALVANRVLNFDLVQYSTIIQLDQQSITDGAFIGFVIFYAEALIFYAVDFATQSINAGIRSGSVGANAKWTRHFFWTLKVVTY